MPRTVAALYLPSVRNLPLPVAPQLAGLGLAGAAALACSSFGQAASVSISVRVVMPPFCVTLKMPSQNSAVSGGAPAFGIEVSVDRALAGVDARADRDALELGSAARRSSAPWGLTRITPLLGTDDHRHVRHGDRRGRGRHGRRGRRARQRLRLSDREGRRGRAADVPAAIDRAHRERVRPGTRRCGAYGDVHAVNAAPSSEHSYVASRLVRGKGERRRGGQEGGHRRCDRPPRRRRRRTPRPAGAGRRAGR